MSHNPAREEWRHDIREANAVARSTSWRIALWTIAVVLFVGAISGGIWLFKVTTSDVKGAGDATRITNDGRNRVNAQEWFHGQMAQIKTADQNLDQAKADLDVATTADDKAFARTNFTGLTNRCNEMVNNYNAEAGKVTRGKWLDSTLPVSIDGNDPATDCKPTPTQETNPR